MENENSKFLIFTSQHFENECEENDYSNMNLHFPVQATTVSSLEALEKLLPSPGLSYLSCETGLLRGLNNSYKAFSIMLGT